MATHHGTEGEVYIGSNKVAEVKEYTYTERADFEEDTPGDETDRTYHATPIKGWRGSITCHMDETDTNGQEAILAGNSVTIHLYPEGQGTGNIEDTGTALIEEVTVNKPMGGGIVERVFQFIGTGALTHQNQS